jgi:excisionase family DNA binding protein
MPDRLLTTREIAERLNISERHARRLLADMPIVRLGRCVRVDQRDLEAWVASRKVAPSFVPDSAEPSQPASPGAVSERWRVRRSRAR